MMMTRIAIPYVMSSSMRDIALSGPGNTTLPRYIYSYPSLLGRRMNEICTLAVSVVNYFSLERVLS